MEQGKAGDFLANVQHEEGQCRFQALPNANTTFTSLLDIAGVDCTDPEAGVAKAL